MLAQLFAESGNSHDESLCIEPGELMMEVLFGEHAEPMEVAIDHEVSFSTQSIHNYMKSAADEVVEEEIIVEGKAVLTKMSLRQFNRYFQVKKKTIKQKSKRTKKKRNCRQSLNQLVVHLVSKFNLDLSADRRVRHQ